MRKNTFKLKKIMLAGVLALVGLFSVVFGSVAPAKVNAAVGDWYETEIEGVYNVDGDLYIGSNYENIFSYKTFYLINQYYNENYYESMGDSRLILQIGENGYDGILIPYLLFNQYGGEIVLIFDLYDEKNTYPFIFYFDPYEYGDFNLVALMKELYPNYNFGYYFTIAGIDYEGNNYYYPYFAGEEGLLSEAYNGEAFTFTYTDYRIINDMYIARIDHAVSTDMNSGDFEAENTFFPCGKYLWNETLTPITQTFTPDTNLYAVAFMTANNIYFGTIAGLLTDNDYFMCYDILGNKTPIYSFRREEWYENNYRIMDYRGDPIDQVWIQDVLGDTANWWEAFEAVPIFIKNNAQKLIKLYKEPEEPEEPPAPPITPPKEEPDPQAITYGIIIFVILLAAAVFVLSSKSRK